MKPGYKTTEYWLCLAVVILSLLAASGIVPAGGAAARLVALATSGLTALGYTAARAWTKLGAVPPEK